MVEGDYPSGGTHRSEAPVEPSISMAPLDAGSPIMSSASSKTSNAATDQPKTEKPKNYTDQLKQDFDTIFESLSLSLPVNKAFLRSRWLDQILWMEAKAAQCRNNYQRLRLITILGGVIVPILVTLDLNDTRAQDHLKRLTIALSGAVAVTAAIEEFFQYGKRWYNYRRAAESLKAQGWHFFQLSGPYRQFEQHDGAFRAFAENIEEIIQRDVEIYVTQNQQEDQEKGQQSSKDKSNDDESHPVE
jgi:Protein of unknown function (DUF4231)